jgi:BlaI family penicillinase repressor
MTNTHLKRPKGLGEVEQMVMDYVWTHGPCSAESCREALADTRPMKDSTVRTILRRLEQKAFLSHEIDGRTFIYRAAENRQNVAVRAVKSIIDRFCGGSAEELVVGLVNSDVIDRHQLERLARKVAQEKPGSATQGRPAKKGDS